MSRFQVKCINKQPRDSTYQGITHLGGDKWKYTRAEVINFIKTKTHTFYTSEGGNMAEIGVYEQNGREYVRTYADGKWNDNLLALPECK